MKGKRRKFSAAFKIKVPIEALKERKSLAELSKRFEVHANMISKWKQDFLKILLRSLKRRRTGKLTKALIQ